MPGGSSEELQCAVKSDVPFLLCVGDTQRRQTVGDSNVSASSGGHVYLSQGFLKCRGLGC